MTRHNKHDPRKQLVTDYVSLSYKMHNLTRFYSTNELADITGLDLSLIDNMINFDKELWIGIKQTKKSILQNDKMKQKISDLASTIDEIKDK